MRMLSLSKRKISISAMSAAAAALFIHGSSADREKIAHAQPVDPLFPVTVIIAAPTTVPIVQEYIGATFALDTVQVNSRVNGYIDQWLFRPGD